MLESRRTVTADLDQDVMQSNAVGPPRAHFPAQAEFETSGPFWFGFETVAVAAAVAAQVTHRLGIARRMAGPIPGPECLRPLAAAQLTAVTATNFKTVKVTLPR